MCRWVVEPARTSPRSAGLRSSAWRSASPASWAAPAPLRSSWWCSSRSAGAQTARTTRRSSAETERPDTPGASGGPAADRRLGPRAARGRLALAAQTSATASAEHPPARLSPRRACSRWRAWREGRRRSRSRDCWDGGSDRSCSRSSHPDATYLESEHINSFILIV